VNEIERCLEFCQRMVPDFASRLQGSRAEDIEALEGAMGRPMAPIHRTFLETMGENTGALDLGRYTTSPASLLASRGDTLQSLPDGTELFAIPTADDEGDVFLVPGEGGYTVVQRGEDEHQLAGSLEELICLPMLNAHYTVRQPLREAYIERTLRPGTLAACRRVGELFGFQQYWFSNAMTWAARRKTLVLIAKQAPGKWFTAGLAGHEEFEFGVILRTLERELDLEPYR
jgi:hypothetical protein